MRKCVPRRRRRRSRNILLLFRASCCFVFSGTRPTIRTTIHGGGPLRERERGESWGPPATERGLCSCPEMTAKEGLPLPLRVALGIMRPRSMPYIAHRATTAAAAAARSPDTQQQQTIHDRLMHHERERPANNNAQQQQHARECSNTHHERTNEHFGHKAFIAPTTTTLR